MFIENKKSGFITFLEYTAYGFFAIFPFFIFKSFLYQGSSSRFLLLCLATAILAIGFGIYLFYEKNRVSFWKSPILLFFGLYFMYLFVSAILGVDFSDSFWSKSERTSGLFYLTHLALFTVFLVHLVSQKESREKLFKVVIFTSALYSFLSLLGPQGFGVMFKTNPYDGFLFGNSSFAAMYLFGAFLLSLYYLFTKNKRETSWHEYLLPVLIVFNPFLLNTNGGYTGVSSVLGIAKASSIGLFVSLGILFVIFLISKIKNIKLKKGFGVFLFSLSLIVLALGMKSLITDGGLVRKIYEKEATLARPVVWGLSKQSIKEKPLTGWGPDNFIEAYQENFDIRILQADFGNESWFDRAHNVVIDQTVDTGYVGVSLYFALYLVIFLSLLYVLLKTKDREDGALASVLITYFFVHLLELQTAFDTTISAVMFALMVALSVYVLNKTVSESGKDNSFQVGKVGKYVLGIVFIGYFSWSLFFGVIPFWGVQNVNWEIRTIGSAEKRIPLYEKLFDTKIDRAGILWRTSTDFQRGIGDKPEIIEDPEKAKFLLEEAKVLTAAYENYVLDNPNHFRSHLNLADMYIYQMLFGVNKLDEADATLDKAIVISGKHPQPYWMKAVISLYRRDFAKARGYVQKAKDMNADVVETQRLEKYIEESIKTFPEIELYSFIQI